MRSTTVKFAARAGVSDQRNLILHFFHDAIHHYPLLK
jgi:hypothetical protein